MKVDTRAAELGLMGLSLCGLHSKVQVLHLNFDQTARSA